MIRSSVKYKSYLNSYSIKIDRFKVDEDNNNYQKIILLDSIFPLITTIKVEGRQQRST